MAYNTGTSSSVMNVATQSPPNPKEVSLDEDFQADGDMLPREVEDWAPNPEELYRVSELRDILIKALEKICGRP